MRGASASGSIYGYALGGALLLAALALYWRSLGYPPAFDDFQLTRFALDDYYAKALSRIGRMRWLSEGSFGLVHVVLGPDPAWQRLVSVLLHAATAISLFGFLSRLFAALLADSGARWLAFFGALWFAVHPVAVYGVAYLVERSIVLATLFSIAALWCVLEGLLRRSAPWYAAAAAAYLLALWSKEHAVMLPAVALALAALVRGAARGFWWTLVVLAALGATAVAQRRWLIGVAYEPFAAELLARSGADPAAAWPLSILNQATLFFRYLATWIVPWPGWMSVDVRTLFPRELLGWPQAPAFLFWLAYPVAACRLLARRGRVGLLGFGMLYPWLLALTEVATVRVQEPFVLYRSYLWMSGLPAVLPFVAARLSFRWQAGLLGALCLLLAGISYGRIQTFSSAFALWDDAARKSTDAWALHAERPIVNRGLAYLTDGRLQAAAADFERALEINHRSPDTYLARGTLRLRSGRLPEALADLDRALALDPRYGAAYNKRCVVKAGLGRSAEALADCDQAVILDSLNPEAWINHGAVLRSVGRARAAAASYERALVLKPGSGSAHYNYGVLLLDMGRRDQATRNHFVVACDAGIAEACDILRRSRNVP
jgi:tetratricopeptide (TPR) repeat protein